MQHLLAETRSGRTAFVIGTRRRCCRHVTDAGLRVLNGTDLASRAEVVVVGGTDGPRLRRPALRRAGGPPRRRPPRHRAATPPTPSPTASGPAPGAILAAVEVATGRKARRSSESPSRSCSHRARPPRRGRTLVVGDRVDSDLAAAAAAELDAALVLSGGTERRGADGVRAPSPSAVADTLADLVLGSTPPSDGVAVGRKTPRSRPAVPDLEVRRPTRTLDHDRRRRHRRLRITIRRASTPSQRARRTRRHHQPGLARPAPAPPPASTPRASCRCAAHTAATKSVWRSPCSATAPRLRSSRRSSGSSSSSASAPRCADATGTWCHVEARPPRSRRGCAACVIVDTTSRTPFSAQVRDLGAAPLGPVAAASSARPLQRAQLAAAAPTRFVSVPACHAPWFAKLRAPRIRPLSPGSSGPCAACSAA